MHRVYLSRPHTLDTEGLQKFWSKITKPSGENGCWYWGKQNSFSYGGFNYGGRAYNVHRLTYELIIGPIPYGKVLRHQCPHKWCCNPAHVLVGTFSENIQDYWDIRLGRKTYSH